MFSPRFLELQTARFWNYTIPEWDAQNEEQKAEAIAYMNSHSMMQKYEEQQQAKRQK